MDTDKTYRVKARWEFYKNATSYFEKIPGSNTPRNNTCTTTYFQFLEPSK